MGLLATGQLQIRSETNYVPRWVASAMQSRASGPQRALHGDDNEELECPLSFSGSGSTNILERFLQFSKATEFPEGCFTTSPTSIFRDVC